MKKLLALFLIFFLIISIENVSAQDDVPKTKFIVWEVQLSPTQLDNMVDALTFQHEFLKEQNYPYAGYVNYTSDGYLWYSTPFQKFAQIDEMNELDETLWEEHPEKQKEIWAKFDGNFKSIGSFILELQPDISLLPTQSSESAEGKQFRFFEKLHIKNGKQMEFMEIAKRYKALYEKHDIEGSYYMYYPQFGPEMSIVYVINDMGSSPAEHYSMNGEKWEKFGEEGKQLWEDFKPIVEKIETHLGTIDNDASYIPAE